MMIDTIKKVIIDNGGEIHHIGKTMHSGTITKGQYMLMVTFIASNNLLSMEMYCQDAFSVKIRSCNVYTMDDLIEAFKDQNIRRYMPEISIAS